MRIVAQNIALYEQIDTRKSYFLYVSYVFIA